MKRWVALTALGFAFATAAAHAQSRIVANGTLAASQSNLAGMDRKLTELDGDQRSAEEELGKVNTDLKTARAKVIEHGRALYRLDRAGLLPLGGGFDALVRYAMQVERTRHVVVRDLEVESKLRGRATELATGIDRISKDRARLQTERAALETQMAEIQEQTRRQAAFDRAFDVSTGPTESISFSNSASSFEPDLPGFRGAKGRLIFPVVARAEIRPARREGTNGPGLEIRAPVGTVVRAVYAGRVAFADAYGPYGKLVIVDHGDKYFTVSANLASIEVKTGAEVSPGERLGTVGDDGQGAMLYFEVRHGSRTLQPGPWLGL